jgi:hypothetical protein
MCHAATSLTTQSAGSAPRALGFRRAGAAGGPPGHPAHDPGGWLRADQVPVRRPSRAPSAEPVRLLPRRRQTAGHAPAGLPAAGTQWRRVSPARSPGSAGPSRPGSGICGGAQGQDAAADHARHRLVVPAAGPGGVENLASHHLKRAAGRSRYTRRFGRAARRFTGNGVPASCRSHASAGTTTARGANTARHGKPASSRPARTTPQPERGRAGDRWR